MQIGLLTWGKVDPFWAKCLCLDWFCSWATRTTQTLQTQLLSLILKWAFRVIVIADNTTTLKRTYSYVFVWHIAFLWWGLCILQFWYVFVRVPCYDILLCYYLSQFLIKFPKFCYALLYLEAWNIIYVHSIYVHIYIIYFYVPLQFIWKLVVCFI